MPFKSQAQRKFMYSQHPRIAKRWEKHTPKGKKLPEHVDSGFYGHMTHLSLQPQEDSVQNIGSGQADADFPKKPTGDSFYGGVKREIY